MSASADPTIIQHLERQTAALLETVAGLTDLSHPSLCEGWSRGHVLAHLARNADGLGNLVRAAHGADVTMYASSERRDADIEEGAQRPPEEIKADCTQTAGEILAALATLTPEDDETIVTRTPGGETFPARRLPLMRLREVVYHHVDLDAGFTFHDVPDDLLDTYVELELRQKPKADVLLWLARGLPSPHPTSTTQEAR